MDSYRDIIWKIQNSRYPGKGRINFARDFRQIYDFYDLMTMFERAQDNRFHVMQALIDFSKAEEKDEEMLQRTLQPYMYLFPILKDYQSLLENCSQDDETWLKETDTALMNSDFMWLREQLSWISMSYTSTDDPLNPHRPDHWITQQIKKVIIDFLEAHLGMLDEEAQEKLKELFMIFIRSIRPKHKNYNSHGSISIINACFAEFDIPYHITAKRARCDKKQIQRWFVAKPEQELHG